MKKLMIIAAGVAASVAVADISSSNVVGYQQFSIPTGGSVVQVATQFKPINQGAKWVFDTKIFDADAAEGDMIHFFDKDKWDIVTYQFQGFDGDESLGWAKMWLEPNGEPGFEFPMSFEVEKGQTLYYEPSDLVSGATVAGETEPTSEIVQLSFPVAGIYNLVNPFPVATTIADLNTFTLEGDMVHMFDESIWDIVSYQNSGDGSWVKMWLEPNGEAGFDFPGDDATVLKAGQGGMYEISDSNGRVWNVSL